MMTRKSIVVFSGGSAANNLVDVFGKLAQDKGCSLSYIIPISDNGGSSSELIRVFGGPGIGDVRSRLVRLIPDTSPSTIAIKALFSHRLTSKSSISARNEWLEIVESRHPLWGPIPSPKRELIRSFLNTINLEIVKRARPSSTFNFQSASVGNLFLTGARLFTGSFESAVYLLGAVCAVPENVQVIPVINSNFSYHISAGLQDGTVITGQNAISHPSEGPPTAAGANDNSHAPTPIPTQAATPIGTQTPAIGEVNSLKHILHHNLSLRLEQEREEQGESTEEDANLPHSHPSLRISSIHFSKSTTTLLPSPISRIWYINPYGQEIRPAANSKVLDCLAEAGCVIYSIGSLYTSIIPSLILRGVGEGISGRLAGGGDGGPKYKILILNGCLDRETSVQNGVQYGAMDFVRAIVEACASSFSPASKIPPLDGPAGGDEWRRYVTHVIYLAGEGTPRVEKEELAGMEIDCVRVYGRKAKDGMVYDGVALGQALEAIIGKRDPKVGEKSRRNTLGITGTTLT